ncbi:MAG TPA: AAA family ATPase, partial [Miltoncostaeaceae bacterium]|nr:AAA family ATPase [Miltoncostaeaceae bacterium]
MTPVVPVTSPSLVGRREVAARLARFSAARGGPVVAALLGDAGIGKTRLADAAVADARERGRAVLVGHANPVDAALPLGVVRDALRGARRRGDVPLEVPDPLGRRFPGLLLPELGEETPEVEQDVLFEAATSFLHCLAAASGLLVVLEDLHAAAGPSLALVGHLARTLDGADVRILLTARPDEAGPPFHALRAELARTRRGVELPLGPLGEAEVAEMLTGLIGRAPSAEALAVVVRTTGGNPFAVEEVVREAVARGRLDPATGAWSGDDALALPWSVREMLVARSRTLPHADQELLRLAAIMGEEVDVLLLGHVAGLRADRLAVALGRLRAAGMLADPAGPPREGPAPVRFRHALAREAILADMLGAERTALHARVLAALERPRGPAPVARVEQLLAHALGAGDAERAVRYLREAALRARALGAHAEAERHLARAAALAAEGVGAGLRAEVLREHGRTLAAIGDRAGAVGVLAAARREALAADDPAGAAEALALSAEARLDLDLREGVVDDLRRAARELEAHGEDGTARRETLARLARAHLVLGDHATAAAAAEEGLARRADAGAVARSLRITLGAARAALGDTEDGVAHLRAGLRACEEAGDVLGALRAHLKLAGAQPRP